MGVLLTKIDAMPTMPDNPTWLIATSTTWNCALFSSIGDLAKLSSSSSSSDTASNSTATEGGIIAVTFRTARGTKIVLLSSIMALIASPAVTSRREYPDSRRKTTVMDVMDNMEACVTHMASDGANTLLLK